MKIFNYYDVISLVRNPKRNSALALGEYFLYFGRSLLSIVLGVILYKATQQLWLFSLVFISEFIASFLVQSIAGRLVDKLGYKIVLDTALAINAVIMLIASLAFLGDFYAIYFILTGAILLNFTRTFVRASVFALVPDLFKSYELHRANGIMHTFAQSGQVSGMILAGVMLNYFQEWHIFSFVTINFLFAFYYYWQLSKLNNKTELQQNNIDSKKINLIDMSEYIKLIKINNLRWLFALGSIDVALIAAFNLLLAPAIENCFSGSNFWLSLISSFYGLGAILGGLYMLKRNRKLQYTVTYTIISLLSISSLFFLYSLNQFTFLAPLLAFSFGLYSTQSMITWSSSLQIIAPRGYLGQVASIRYFTNALLVAVTVLALTISNSLSFEIASLVASIMSLSYIIICILNKKSATYKALKKAI